MEPFKTTRLWRTTLAVKKNDSDEDARERLRTSFLKFRDRAGELAAEIGRDMKDYTLHDLAHIDAVWEAADLILGEDFELTPTEAYVLGGAILVHDLAMTLSAYPGRLEEIERHERWLDTIYVHMRHELGRPPTEAELAEPSQDVIKIAKEELLRELHSDYAVNLPQQAFSDRERSTSYYLIEDIDLRQNYGLLIGQLASSHGWDSSKLRDAFPQILGAPAGAPRSWTVDPLTIACLVRVADASQLEATRAPTFTRILRDPGPSSRPHWIFQERLQQVRREVDRLIYTSSRPFTLREAPAWWLCLDTLKMVDKELRQVDALLADNHKPRFAARSVAYVDDPIRLTTYIPTDGWLPIDARLRVGDVGSLVRKLGGEELYGRDMTVPLRELIQNGADAVRALRVLEGDPNSLSGSITVTINDEPGNRWLEVADSGIGMSKEVLAGALLDFGQSYWGSYQMRLELPGLLSKGFYPTGQYGIGFFSVFMLGERVRVTSRRYDDSVQNTFVLEFGAGVTERPILRRANKDEQLKRPGSRVQVVLNDDLEFGVKQQTSQGASKGDGQSSTVSLDWLTNICIRLFPALDVDLLVSQPGTPPQKAVAAKDWLTLEPQDLLHRVVGERYGELSADESIHFETVVTSSGEIAGRSAIVPTMVYYQSGILTVGGARTKATLRGTVGIWRGRSIRVARDLAIPIGEPEAYARWATRQAEFLVSALEDPEKQADVASTVLGLRGEPGGLALGLTRDGWLNAVSLPEWSSKRQHIILLHDAGMSNEIHDHGAFELAPDVLVIEMAALPILSTESFDRSLNTRAWPDERKFYVSDSPLANHVFEVIASSWGKSVPELLGITEAGEEEAGEEEAGEEEAGEEEAGEEEAAEEEAAEGEQAVPEFGGVVGYRDGIPVRLMATVMNLE
jgi:hypothetical protein